MPSVRKYEFLSPRGGDKFSTIVDSVTWDICGFFSKKELKVLLRVGEKLFTKESRSEIDIEDVLYLTSKGIFIIKEGKRTYTVRQSSPSWTIDDKEFTLRDNKNIREMFSQIKLWLIENDM